MNRDRLSIILMIFSFIVLWPHKMLPLSSLAKNDPYPIFSTTYPYNYLLESTKLCLKECPCDYECACCFDYFSIAFSGIYQKANKGRNYDREKVPLGDLEGRWHMLGMLYGPVPVGNPNACPNTLMNTRLGEAKQTIFGVMPNDIVPQDLIRTDSMERVGFFTVPIKYRKNGVRFEVCVQPHPDFGLMLQGGYVEIKQTLTDFIDLTPSFTETMFLEGVQEGLAPQFTEEQINLIQDLLMSASSANRIFREQGIEKRSNTVNVCDFRESSFEDLRFSLWARHVFQLNKCCCDWPEFLLIPFFNFEGSIPGSRKLDRMNFLAAPFGNNGHYSLGFTSGFHIDFIETLEIGFHGGITHFFARDVDKYRLPNDPTQSGVFPFATDVRLQPGRNSHFSVSIHAFRFLDKLSAWAEFVVVNHDEDHITLKDPSLASIFEVRQQECLTKFASQFITTTMNYEISPNLSLGFAAQWPLQQRNAYRSTTILGTIKGIF
ncbi:MAG: hypothetical protein WDZ41_00470 [Candidatus Babeliales bacterium]